MSDSDPEHQPFSACHEVTGQNRTEASAVFSRVGVNSRCVAPTFPSRLPSALPSACLAAPELQEVQLVRG